MSRNLIGKWGRLQAQIHFLDLNISFPGGRGDFHHGVLHDHVSDRNQYSVSYPSSERPLQDIHGRISVLCYQGESVTHTDTDTDTQTHEDTDRQTDRQTDRHMHTHMHTHTHTHIHTHKHSLSFSPFMSKPFSRSP